MKKYLPFLVIFLMWSHTAFANTCVWVGGTHNWSDTTAWTGCGGVAPTAGDDALVGTGSGGSTTGTLTIDGTSGSPSKARSVNFTSFTGTVTFANGKQIDVGDASGGSVTGPAGFSFSGSSPWGLWHMVSTTTGNTITFGNHSGFNTMTFDGVGGSWSYSDAPSSTAGTTTLTNGTLSLNNQTFTIGTFNSTSGGTRVLNMGSGTITVSSQWNVGNLSTGLTINGGTSTIVQQFSASGPNFGDQTYYNYSQNATGAFNPTITGNATFSNNFTANSPNVTSGITIHAGNTLTVGGTLTLTGNSFSQNTRLLVRSDAYGVPASIVVNGTVTVSRIDLKDIHASGSASWNIASVTGNSGDCGGNSGITFTTPANQYAKTTTTVNMSAVPWKTTSGGGVSGRIPLCQDTGIFDSNAFSTTSITINSDVSRIGGLDFTGATNSPTLNMSGSTEIYGSLTLISGMTLSGTSTLNFEGSGASSFTTAGKSIPWPTTVGSNVTWTPQDAITSTNSLTVYDYSTVTTNGFNHQFSTITFSGGTTTLTNQLTATGAIAVNSSIAPATINIKNGGDLIAATTLATSGTSTVINIYPGGAEHWGSGSAWSITPGTETVKALGDATFSANALTVAPSGTYTSGF